MAWILLTAGALIGVVANTLLKRSDGFTHIWLGVSAFTLFAVAIYFFSISIRTLPMGVAYAVWSGIGILAITVVGMIWFKEPVSIHSAMFMGMILVGCIGLNYITQA